MDAIFRLKMTYTPTSGFESERRNPTNGACATPSTKPLSRARHVGRSARSEGSGWANEPLQIVHPVFDKDLTGNAALFLLLITPLRIHCINQILFPFPAFSLNELFPINGIKQWAPSVHKKPVLKRCIVRWKIWDSAWSGVPRVISAGHLYSQHKSWVWRLLVRI